jgi:Domain of unknown function (DUF1917)
VAQSTAAGELGFAAKVAPWNQELDPTNHKDRLICVYTHDLSDLHEIGLVISKLRSLGVVGITKRRSFYKPGEFHMFTRGYCESGKLTRDE